MGTLCGLWSLTTLTAGWTQEFPKILSSSDSCRCSCKAQVVQSRVRAPRNGQTATEWKELSLRGGYFAVCHQQMGESVPSCPCPQTPRSLPGERTDLSAGSCKAQPGRACAGAEGWATALTDGVGTVSPGHGGVTPIPAHISAPGDKAGVSGTRLLLNQPKRDAHRNPMVTPSLHLLSFLHQDISLLEERDGKQLVTRVSEGVPGLPCQEPRNR